MHTAHVHVLDIVGVKFLWYAFLNTPPLHVLYMYMCTQYAGPGCPLTSRHLVAVVDELCPHLHDRLLHLLHELPEVLHLTLPAAGTPTISTLVACTCMYIHEQSVIDIIHIHTHDEEGLGIFLQNREKSAATQD